MPTSQTLDSLFTAEGNLDLLRNLASEFTEIQGSCAFAHVSGDLDGSLTSSHFPKRVKVNGMVVLLLVKGGMQVEINTEQYYVEAPALLSLSGGSLVQLSATAPDQIPECYVMAYTPSFLKNVNISFSAVTSGGTFIERPAPYISLEEREIKQLMRYFSLMYNAMADDFNVQLNRHIISNITTAMFYQVTKMLYKRIESVHTGINPRRSSYVEDFMRLVHVHYTRERSVSFYASRLFISPKYLSLLVKEATGRSAARWIDFFVISEAKNLLRYSGKNVQQVAYALNFTNQSSFGKYFKHVTGMSPTEYQKS